MRITQEVVIKVVLVGFGVLLLWGFLAAVAAINCNRPGKTDPIFYDSVVLKPKSERCTFDRSKYMTVCSNGDLSTEDEDECGKCASGPCEAHGYTALFGLFLLGYLFVLVVVVCNCKAGTSGVAG